jgi:hypothetical protein
MRPITLPESMFIGFGGDAAGKGMLHVMRRGLDSARTRYAAGIGLHNGLAGSARNEPVTVGGLPCGADESKQAVGGGGRDVVSRSGPERRLREYNGGIGRQRAGGNRFDIALRQRIPAISRGVKRWYGQAEGTVGGGDGRVRRTAGLDRVGTGG